MADAIPVHSEPKKGKRTVNVEPAPNASPELVDGVVQLGEYAAKQRDGLGDGSEFNKGTRTKVEVPLTVERIVEVDGKAQRVQEVVTHRAIRTDH